MRDDDIARLLYFLSSTKNLHLSFRSLIFFLFSMFRRTWRIKSWRPTSGWSRYLPNLKSLLIYLPLNMSNFSSGFPPIKVLVRLQTHVGAIRVRWGEHAPRSVRSHLEAGHQPLQQVSRFVSLVYYTYCRPAELQQQTRVRESLTSLL